MRVLVTGAYHSIQVRYPMSELRGSCLASTAVLHSLAEEQLWLHWLTQEARPCSACRTRSIVIDRERFTQARRSCLEPAPKRLEKNL